MMITRALLLISIAALASAFPRAEDAIVPEADLIQAQGEILSLIQADQAGDEFSDADLESMLDHPERLLSPEDLQLVQETHDQHDEGMLLETDIDARMTYFSGMAKRIVKKLCKKGVAMGMANDKVYKIVQALQAGSRQTPEQTCNVLVPKAVDAMEKRAAASRYGWLMKRVLKKMLKYGLRKKMDEMCKRGMVKMKEMARRVQERIKRKMQERLGKHLADEDTPPPPPATPAPAPASDSRRRLLQEDPSEEANTTAEEGDRRLLTQDVEEKVCTPLAKYLVAAFAAGASSYFG